MSARMPRMPAGHGPGRASKSPVRAPRDRAGARRAGAAGQSAAEYLIVLALLSLALTVGPDSPLEQVFRAFAERYEQFTYAMSRP